MTSRLIVTSVRRADGRRRSPQPARVADEQERQRQGQGGRPEAPPADQRSGAADPDRHQDRQHRQQHQNVTGDEHPLLRHEGEIGEPERHQHGDLRSPVPQTDDGPDDRQSEEGHRGGSVRREERERKVPDDLRQPDGRERFGIGVVVGVHRRVDQVHVTDIVQVVDGVQPYAGRRHGEHREGNRDGL
jgi:hypothetical protein